MKIGGTSNAEQDRQYGLQSELLDIISRPMAEALGYYTVFGKSSSHLSLQPRMNSGCLIHERSPQVLHPLTAPCSRDYRKEKH
jgi:hypothetical protein